MLNPAALLKGTAICVVLFSFAAHAAHADPAGGAPGVSRISLNGTWDFTIQPGQAAGVDNSKWDNITVPGNWDTLPAYWSYAGKGWYRRTFDLPASWKGNALRLRFDAVNYETHVFLNGAEIGSHVGGYTPFEFDVTDKVAYGRSNTLVVSADNSLDRRGAWWHWGGISRSVTLFADNAVRLVWQHITATPDLVTRTASVSVEYVIANTGPAAKTVRLNSQIYGTGLPAAQTEVSVAPRTESQARLQFDLPAEFVRLWDFDHPNLYTLITALYENDATVDSKSDRFGIRKVEVKPDGLWLNGEKVRLCGFNRVSDGDKFGNTEPDALVHRDIDLMKNCGADMARLMHFAQAPNLLDYLDEKGMLIFEEIPVWGAGDPNVRQDNPLTEQWLREMIDRDYNHPCIVGWSPGNELWQHYAYIKSMHDYIRRNLDSSRLLTYVSNTAARQDAGPSNDPATVSDLILLNAYKWFSGPLETVHKRWPDKPVFFSEWGYGQIGAKPNATIPHFEDGLMKSVKGHPYLIGLSLWTFNDYRNGFKTGGAPSGNREWGVVDMERRPKAAYCQVRRAYSPVHALTVAGGEIRIEPRSPEEVPSYALRGYSLKWETTGGGPVKSGAIPVPDLRPGDPPWESACAAEGPLKVSLITPTGYDVTDATGSR